MVSAGMVNALAESRWPNLQCIFMKLAAYPVSVLCGKLSVLPALLVKPKENRYSTCKSMHKTITSVILLLD